MESEIDRDPNSSLVFLLPFLSGIGCGALALGLLMSGWFVLVPYALIACGAALLFAGCAGVLLRLL